MAEQAAKEPTMEEILSSIRRIISEGGEPEAETGSAAPELTEVSENTGHGDAFDVSELLSEHENDVAPEEGEHLLSVDELLGSDDLDFAEMSDDSSLEVDEIELPSLGEDLSAEPQVALDDSFDSDIDDLDSLLGEVDAIEAASEAVAVEPTATPEPTPMPQPAPTPVTPPAASAAALSGNATLEGLVSELMKPVIKEWIDANLPTIVERRVQEEINQIAAKVIAALRD